MASWKKLVSKRNFRLKILGLEKKIPTNFRSEIFFCFPNTFQAPSRLSKHPLDTFQTPSKQLWDTLWTPLRHPSDTFPDLPNTLLTPVIPRHVRAFPSVKVRWGILFLLLLLWESQLLLRSTKVESGLYSNAPCYCVLKALIVFCTTMVFLSNNYKIN